MAATEKSRRMNCARLALVAIALLATPARATLVFYYDPDTGNVAFDTAGTTSGSISSYSLSINPYATELRFRPENHIRLFESTLYFTKTNVITENSVSETVSGYFTIGNVLPPNITEEVWLSSYPEWRKEFFQPEDSMVGGHGYYDLLARGTKRPPAEFVYGQPDQEYDNRTDVLDPNTLNWAETVSLIYIQSSGELLLDNSGPDGGYMTSILLESDGQFIPENFDPFVDVPLTVETDDEIFMAIDLVDPGQYTLGRILRPNLSPEEFQSTFTNVRFLSRAGYGGASYDFINDGLSMNLTFRAAVPEPATLTLALAISAVLLVLPRKHRSC